MKKTIIIIFLIIIIKLIIPIKPYVELNNIKIIKEINVSCNNTYTITLKEIQTVKDNNGIKYKYKNKTIKDENIDKILNRIKNDNKIYIKKAKIKDINCNKKEKKLVYTSLNLHH